MAEKDPLVAIVREAPGKISISFPKGTAARLKAKVRLSKVLGAIGVEAEGQDVKPGDLIDERC